MAMSQIAHYWKWWKRGLWFQLLMLVFNAVLLVLMLPALLFLNTESLYYIVATAIYVTLCVPFGGWLYSKFAARTQLAEQQPPANG